MQSIGMIFFIIAILAVHYTFAPTRKKIHKPYSINEWLHNPVQQKLDDADKDSLSLLTVEEIRNVFADAKMKSKADPTVDDNREEQ